MATYKYKPYYNYRGPTFSQPFRKELAAEKVEENIAFFFERLDSHFVGTDAVVIHDNAGTASVTTDLSEGECDEIVKGLLNYLDLYAHKS